MHAQGTGGQENIGRRVASHSAQTERVGHAITALFADDFRWWTWVTGFMGRDFYCTPPPSPRGRCFDWARLKIARSATLLTPHPCSVFSLSTTSSSTSATAHHTTLRGVEPIDNPRSFCQRLWQLGHEIVLESTGENGRHNLTHVHLVIVPPPTDYVKE